MTPVEGQRCRNTEVPSGLGRKLPQKVLFERFWAPGSECPRECVFFVFSVFLALQGSKSVLPFLGVFASRNPWSFLAKNFLGLLGGFCSFSRIFRVSLGEKILGVFEGFPWHLLSGPLRLRVQSRSRTRLRIAASIAILFRACFKGV